MFGKAGLKADTLRHHIVTQSATDMGTQPAPNGISTLRLQSLQKVCLRLPRVDFA